jgi:hypothetical protein
VGTEGKNQVNLYEYYNPCGDISEVVADQHIDAWEFFRAVKKMFGVEVKPGSIVHMWEQKSKGSERKFILNKSWGSAPVTIGIVNKRD